MKKGLNFSKLRESLFTGIREILFNKSRSFLTLTGIMLGVASLIAMMSITEGYRKNFTEFMDAWGGLARITVNNLDDTTLASMKELYNVKGLTIEDVKRISEENTDIIKLVCPQKQNKRFTIKYGNKSLQLFGSSVVGTTKTFAEINNLTIDQGRNIGDFDDITHSRVCVIGSIPTVELFGENLSPVNEKISLNGRYLTVVGNFEEYTTDSSSSSSKSKTTKTSVNPNRRKLAITSQDKVENISARTLWQKYGMSSPLWRKNCYVVMPLSTYSLLFDTEEMLDSIEIEFYDSEHINDYIERVKQTLRKTRSGYEDFSIDTKTELFEQTQKQMQTMSWVFGAIALISLFVGGIGIMNVILASISERIREIGVRKSVGARNFDIFAQFLIETMVLAFIGGLMGVIVGSGIAVLIAKLASMSTLVSVFSIALALTSSCIIGLIFGIYPSLKAAKLNPIDALRYE